MQTQTKTVLKRARAKIAQGWTQNAVARGAAGFPVLSFSRDARCWCAMGAVLAVTSEGDGLQRLRAALPQSARTDNDAWHDVSVFNDHPGRTQAEVLALFDRAISLAEEQTS